MDSATMTATIQAIDGDGCCEAHNARISRLEAGHNALVPAIGRLEDAIRDMEAAMKEVAAKVDTRLERMEQRAWMNFYWMVGGFASVLGTLAHAMHWV